MSEVLIKRYDPADKQTWDDFVGSAANATFLFYREYMDYHADRIKDHSLLIYLRGKLVALLVANEEGTIINSHSGLTYGGMLLAADARLEDVLTFFFHALRYYSMRFKTMIYKCVPAPFMKQHTNQDLYAMFLLKAELVARNTASAFERMAPIPYQQRRKKSVRSASTIDWKLVRATDPELFWDQVLVPNLQQRFEASPVHSAAEMKRLIEEFPENIHLYELHTSEIVAGAVIYVNENIAHAQYLSATAIGKEFGALDILVDQLITTTFADKNYFSLGTSNEKDGSLNRGLVNWKEGFGTRIFLQDTYRVSLDMHTLLTDYE
jgi:hypothetical protein